MSLEVWLQAPKMVLANLFQSLCHLSIFLAEYDVFFFFTSTTDGNLVVLPCWRCVSSCCVNVTEERPLIGFPTLMFCPNPTPAQSISPTMSWLFCLPLCNAKHLYKGKRYKNFTHPVKTFSGE